MHGAPRFVRPVHNQFYADLRMCTESMVVLISSRSPNRGIDHSSHQEKACFAGRAKMQIQPSK